MSRENISQYMGRINDRCGQGAARLATDIPNVRLLPTGVFALDYATFGGISEGNINILIGKEQAGKTTMALRIIANVFRKYSDLDEDDVYVVFADCEGTFDKSWAEQLGIPLERLILIEPGLGENVVDALVDAANQPEIKAIVLDSIPALIGKRQVSKSAHDDTMADTAVLAKKLINPTLVAQSARRVEGNPVTMIMINSYRYKIGVMFGDNRTMPGGEAPRIMAKYIIEVKLVEESEGKDDSDLAVIKHNKHKFKLIKFKGPKHLKEAEYNMVRVPDFELPMGAIDDYSTVLTYAKKHGLITGGGSKWRIFGIEEPFRNQAEMRQYMIDNYLDYIDLQARIIGLRRLAYGMPELPPDDYLLRYHTEGLSLDDGLVAEELPATEGDIVEDDDEEDHAILFGGNEVDAGTETD